MTTINLKLNPSQFDFFTDSAAASLFVGGVGSGKSYIGARLAIAHMLQFPQAIGLISANTYDQLHQSTLPALWDAMQAQFGWVDGRDYSFGVIPPWIKGKQSNEIFKRFSKVIALRNGALVIARSLEKYKHLEGLNLGWAWIDEAKDAKREAFDVVLARLRSKEIPQPKIFITTTPNGFDWLYEYFEKDTIENPDLKNRRHWFNAPTEENRRNLAAGFIENLYQSYDENLARQMLRGEWIDIFKGRVYYSFERSLHISQKATFSFNKPVYLCCDFNVDPMSWIVAQPGPHDEIFVIDEIVIRNSNVAEACREFWDRYPGAQYVKVFGDASGYARSTTGKSDYRIMQEFGFKKFYIPSKNPFVVDRIAAMNAKLHSAAGKIGVLINPKCKHLINDFLKVSYKPGTRKIDKSKLNLTHTSDALGYCISILFPAGQKSNPRMIPGGF